MARYTKTSRSHLLDRRTLPIAVRLALETRLVLSSFTAVTLSTNAVHRDGQRRVGFVGNRSKRHRARCKTLEDVCHRLNLIQRNRVPLLKFKQSAESQLIICLIVDLLRVFLEYFVVVGFCRVL